MSQTTGFLNNAKPSQSLPDGVDDMVNWIKNWLAGPPFQKNVGAIPIALADGLGSGQKVGSGQQPGVYVKLNDVKGIFWKGMLSQQGNQVDNLTGCVVLNTKTPNSGSTLWIGLIFHEYGHAALGPLEPCAWTVELISLQAYLATLGGAGKLAFAEKLRTFVKARKVEGCYTSFVSGHDIAARAAYAELAGEAL